MPTTNGRLGAGKPESEPTGSGASSEAGSVRFLLEQGVRRPFEGSSGREAVRADARYLATLTKRQLDLVFALGSTRYSG
jgi:hypothetical protein